MPGATERPSDLRRNAALLIAFALLQLAYQAAVQPFTGPDEDQHLAYVRGLAHERRLPILEALPRAVRDASGRRIGVALRPTGLSGPVTFQAQHPPLAYCAYVVPLLICDAAGWPERWIRLVGLAWGLLAIIGLARLGAELFGEDSFVARALPAFVLLPGPVYHCAVINNDGLALAIGAWLLWRMACLFGRSPTLADAAWLGGLLGLGLATKSTLLPYAPAGVIVVLAASRRGGATGRQTLGRLALFLAVAILPVGWWWWRNQALYGTPLPRAHANPILLSTGQLWQHEDAPFLVGTQVGMTLAMWLPTTLAHLWLLQEKWNILMGIYLSIWAVALLGLVGVREWWRSGPPREQALTVVLSLALVGLMVLLYLWQFLFQDFEVAMFGGRYFLPLLGALAIPWLVGVGGTWGGDKGRRRAAWLAAAFVFCGIVLWPLAWHPPVG